MERQKKVYQVLDGLGIPYQVMQHPAAFTIEDMDALDISNKDDIVKNLFLKDARGNRHFLVIVDKNKKVDLKKLRSQLCTSALSFASAERLKKYLQLAKGEVTPFGVLNDSMAEVEVIFDNDLVGRCVLGVHPNDNRATVLISYNDLKKIIENNGNTVHNIDI